MVVCIMTQFAQWRKKFERPFNNNRISGINKRCNTIHTKKGEEMNFKLECSACGIKQTRPGMCWDDDKCAKCYYSETMTDVKRNVSV